MRGALVLLAIVACKAKSEPPTPAPAPGPVKPSEPAKAVRATSMLEGFVVIVPKGRDAEAIEKQMHEQFATAKLVGDVLPMEMPPMTPDDRKVLTYVNPDLTPADLDGIVGGKAFAVKATGEPVTTLRALAAIAEAGAAAAHGWVEDPLAGGAFTAAQFANHVPGDPVDVRKQIYVHSVSGEGELPFLDTMGMAKLGLPDLKVAAAAGSQLKELTILINATAQTLLAHPDISVPGTLDVDLASLPGDWQLDVIRKNGGSGRARWVTRWSAADHSDEQMIELVPATGSGTEGAGRLIDGCFGREPDTVISAKDDDPELAAAARRARKELLELRSHFAKGVPFKEKLLVNAPFTDHGKTEWMWVEVVTWKDDAFHGTLVDQPNSVKNVREGSEVTIPFAQVADYIHVHADGTKVGGYSDEILLRREGSR